MNIQDVERYFENNYHNYEKSVRDVSYDDANDEYMLEDLPYKMYCYDDIIDVELCGVEVLKSVDGISIHNNAINFIEFKNGKFDRKDILGKVSQGMHYLQEVLLGKTYFSISGIKTRFILVYNEEKCNRKKPSLDKLIDTMSEKAKEPTDRWSIGRLYAQKWQFFDEATSMDKEQFSLRIGEFVGK